LSRPGWLTYNGRFTHISGHPSASGRAQDRKSSPLINNYSQQSIPNLLICGLHFKTRNT